MEVGRRDVRVRPGPQAKRDAPPVAFPRVLDERDVQLQLDTWIVNALSPGVAEQRLVACGVGERVALRQVDAERREALEQA